ncbi:MAG: sodium/proline symporter [Bacteroidota bacterium]
MLDKYLILISYFAILFLIGKLSSSKIKNISDYFVGGKKLGYWVVAFSSRATGASAWVLLGLTGMGAVYGISAYWVALGTTLGVIISWFFMATKFKQMTNKFASITIPDFLVSRFQATGHLLRGISATVLSVFVIIYVSSQIDATGTAFETFLGWDYYVGALVGFVIVVIYTFSGGFVAVAWSDVFQGSIMLFGLVALPLVAFGTSGGFNEIILKLNAIEPSLLSIWGEGGLNLENFVRITGFVMIGLGYLGSPQLFVRFLSIKNEAEIKKGRWVAVTLQLVMNVAAVSIGILGRVLLTESGEDLTAKLGNGGQDVLIKLTAYALPFFTGIYIAAVLAAIMSTVDSLLVLASSAVTRDFYQKIFHPELNDARLVGMSKIVTLILAGVALSVALIVAFLVPGRTIFWFVIFGWSGLAASFCPVIILAIFWKGFSERGAIATMISGFLSVPFFKFYVSSLPYIGSYFQLLAELLPSFIIALLAGLLFNKK